jgi:uncharacterized protein YggU (UPF0235/DUF167 family)
MIGREFKFHNGKKGSALAIRIKKGSGKKRLIKVLKDGTLIVNFPRRTNDLNRELVDFLSLILNISKQRIDIIAGREGNEKLLSIVDMEPAAVQDIILRNLS